MIEDVNDDVNDNTLTSLQRQHDELRQAFGELALALNSHSVVAVTDSDGVILSVNQKFVEYSKYSAEELIGQTHRIINSGVHDPEFFENMWTTISSGHVWKREICNRAKDGSLYWVDATIYPVVGADGRPERYISIRTLINGDPKIDPSGTNNVYTDRLTKLPNRAALLASLERCTQVEQDDYCAFVAVSLDELSTINEAFGYASGDQLLLHAAAQLTGLRLPDRAVGRIDPRVFGIILGPLGTDRALADTRVREVVEQVIGVLSGDIDLEQGMTVQGSATAGYIVYQGGTGIDANEVMKSAELARKRASSSHGQHRIGVFEPEMVERAQDRISMLLELRRGIADGELRLFTQPIVDQDRRVLGYEALIRWVSPTRGLVAPAEFIPLAEATGLIVELGAWMLEQSCRILAEWSKTPETAERTLSINLSERELHIVAFEDRVLEVTGRHGVSPQRLHFEITESMLHADLEHSVRVLERLRSHGFSIALDDFGTGYSSLNYLKRLPVQQLKIDRSFVTPILDNPDEAAIVQTIVGLARILGLQVVAEGVETEEQFEMLRLLGVDAYQGYLFGRPESQVSA